MHRNCVSNVFQEELKSLLHPFIDQDYPYQGGVNTKTHLACSGTAAHGNGIPEYRNSKGPRLSACPGSFRISSDIAQMKEFSPQSLYRRQVGY
jgi:hypothetical protein